MAFTPKDSHALMNALVRQATGQQAITVIDSSTFVSAGELVLQTGMENVFNSLNIVLGRLIVANRPYNAKLTLMDEIDTGAYTNRLRKVSYYTSDTNPSGAFNTDLFTNLANGYTSGDNGGVSTKSQWEQNLKNVVEVDFGVSSTWQYCITMYEDAVKLAFRDENEFARFISGYLVEHANDIESQRESWNRMLLCNKIASVYDESAKMNGSVVNLTKAFNDKFDTTYTSEELRTTHLKEFLEFFISEFKLASEHMTERTVNYHNPLTKTVDGVNYHVVRHTPYRDQRVYLFDELFIESESMVMPEIFNPQYLDINTQFERVTYWQSVNDRPAIKFTPAITGNDGRQTAGETVDLSYVVGMITDRDGLISHMQLNRVDTTPLEARKHYRNTWHTFMKGGISDNTENCIIFIMKDEEP